MKLKHLLIVTLFFCANFALAKNRVTNSQVTNTDNSNKSINPPEDSEQTNQTEPSNANANTNTNESKNKKPAYNFGAEFLKQLLASIEKDKFYLNINLDMTYSNNRSEATVYNIFDIESVLQFKTRTEGITLSIFAPSSSPTEEEKKLDFKFKLDLSNKVAILHLKKGSKPTEFIGDIQFFTIDKNSSFKPDSINFKISNELIDIKELQLFGATIKINLPEQSNASNTNNTDNTNNTNSTNQSDPAQKSLKKGLINALIECKAESQVTDVLTGEVAFAPLEKCLFNFDGERLKVQYKDSRRTLPQDLL